MPNAELFEPVLEFGQPLADRFFLISHQHETRGQSKRGLIRDFGVFQVSLSGLFGRCRLGHIKEGKSSVQFNDQELGADLIRFLSEPRKGPMCVILARISSWLV